MSTAATATVDADQALIALGGELRRLGYGFTTVTPATHQRVNARRQNALARDLRDVLGWSRPFRPGTVPAAIEEALRAGDALAEDGDLLRSRVRFSSVGDLLLMHSAFPTLAADAVFLGPDTWRFVDFVRRAIGETGLLVDIGCGTGAGGLALAGRCAAVVLADRSPAAVRYARINATINGHYAGAEGAPRSVSVSAVTTQACPTGGGGTVLAVESDVLSAIAARPHAVIANPPYLVDALGRTYRDGGGELGTGLALRMARAALRRLEPGGRLALYTGAPVVAGVDRFRAAVLPLCAAAGARVDYHEIDPDVFGDELDALAYAEVERIAAVGLIADLPT